MNCIIYVNHLPINTTFLKVILMNRNATASWSGYSHQGKAGILVSLIQINNIIQKCDDSEIEHILNEWLIEYEGAEDFDIKHKETVISRHQVKAKSNGSYPNNYKDVLGVLKYQLINGYLKRINPGFQICDYDKDGNPREIEVDKESRFLHTITEVKGFDLNFIEF